jgi:DNA-binding protein H-NS
MPRPSKYQKMPLKALIAEREKISAAIEEKLSAEREAFRAEVEEKASMLGMNLRALFGKKKRRAGNGGQGRVAVKFRNPKNLSETWSGRGRPARWLVRETDGDKRKFEKFLVR